MSDGDQRRDRARGARPPFEWLSPRLARVPAWKRYDAKHGLTLHQAAIFYGEDYPAKTVWELELGGYGELLDVQEDGWPTPPAEIGLRMRLESCRRELHGALLRLLRKGTLYATGFSAAAAIDMPAARIHASRWLHLEPDFEASSAEGLGQRIHGILVFKLAAASGTPSQRAFSPAKGREWYVRWVQANEARGHVPSRDEDLQAAKAEFGDRCPREPIRELRRLLAPAHWTFKGRRKLTSGR